MPFVKHANGRGGIDGMDDVGKQRRAFAWEGVWLNGRVVRPMALVMCELGGAF